MNLVRLLTLTAISLIHHGCTPPDWNVCECQWLDNYWFHHIWYLHQYTGPNFIYHLLSPTSPMHDWIMKQNCPDRVCIHRCKSNHRSQVHTFMYNSESKYYSFDPKGLMELSREAWRPERRSTITNACPVGNMILHILCAHQYLYKAGSTSTTDQQWEFLRSWYSHMTSIQKFIDQPEIVACISRSPWPFNNATATALIDWTYSTIGNATLGEEPNLLFNQQTGLIHVPSFALPASVHLQHSRRNVAPKNRVCLPLVNPQCWPKNAKFQSESCTLCCDPSKGPFGHPSCWSNGRSYEQCCQQDFKFVMCDEIRKETPGCIDCPQHLSYYCEEENTFRVVRAWSHMNETFWKYKEEVNVTRDLESNITVIRADLELHESEYNRTIHPMAHAFSNFHVSINSNPSKRIAYYAKKFRHFLLSELTNITRPPINKNFTHVKRARDDAFARFSSYNNTYHTATLDEAKQRERKKDLIDNFIPKYHEEIANLTRWKIPQIKGQLEILSKLGNETHEKLTQLNSTKNSNQAVYASILSNFNDTILQIQNRESEMGIASISSHIDGNTSVLNKSKTQLESVVMKKLKNFETLLATQEQFDRDCKSIIVLNSSIQAAQAELSNLTSRIIPELESKIRQIQLSLNSVPDDIDNVEFISLANKISKLNNSRDVMENELKEMHADLEISNRINFKSAFSGFDLDYRDAQVVESKFVQISLVWESVVMYHERSAQQVAEKISNDSAKLEMAKRTCKKFDSKLAMVRQEIFGRIRAIQDRRNQFLDRSGLQSARDRTFELNRTKRDLLNEIKKIDEKIFSKMFIQKKLEKKIAFLEQQGGEWSSWGRNILLNLLPLSAIPADQLEYVKTMHAYWNLEEDLKNLRFLVSQKRGEIEQIDFQHRNATDQYDSIKSTISQFEKQTIEPQKFLVNLKLKSVKDDLRSQRRECRNAGVLETEIRIHRTRLNHHFINQGSARVQYDLAGTQLESVHSEISNLIELKKFLQHHNSLLLEFVLTTDAAIAQMRAALHSNSQELKALEKEIAGTRTHQIRLDIESANRNLSISQAELTKEAARSTALHLDIEKLISTRISAMESCGHYSNREHRRHIRDLDWTKKEGEKLIEIIDKISTDIFRMQSERTSIIGDSTELLNWYSQRDKLQEQIRTCDTEIKKITEEQKILMNNFSENSAKISRLDSELKVSLSRQTLLVDVELPKSQSELSIKDDVILNLTKKQIEFDEKRQVQFPFLAPNESVFVEWNTTMSGVDAAIQAALKTYTRIDDIYEQLAPNNTAKHLLHEHWSNETFFSFNRLNKTYFNLTEYEEKLMNSTKKTNELVEEFKAAEMTYFEKEKIYDEYKKKVDAGIIPKINFIFEY